MTVNHVFEALNTLAPFHTQMGFDNAGILIGSACQKVTKVGVALDVTLDVLNQAIEQGVDCVVSHHPIIFSGLKAIPTESVVYRAIQHSIAVISAHTNLDAAQGGVNDCLAQQLGLCDIEPIGLPDEPTPAMGRVGMLSGPMTADDFAKLVGEQLNTRAKYVSASRMIQKIVVCGGAGADFLEPAMLAKADALVTAEVKHHQFLMAAEADFMLVDAGHFETEQVVLRPLCDYLNRELSCPVALLHQASPTSYC